MLRTIGKLSRKEYKRYLATCLKATIEIESTFQLLVPRSPRFLSGQTSDQENQHDRVHKTEQSEIDARCARQELFLYAMVVRPGHF